MFLFEEYFFHTYFDGSYIFSKKQFALSAPSAFISVSEQQQPVGVILKMK